jgi:uncharacterized protein YjbJ (UPF0337 family)
MNNSPLWDKIAGSWKQFRGEVRKQWGKLTDDDLEQIKGQRDILIGKIQNAYGITRDEANRQINEWENRVHE